MKKFLFCAISALLCICLLVLGLPVCAAAEEPLRFWVAADTHFYSETDLGERTAQYAENMLDAELYDYVSSQGQMQYESRAIVQAMLDAFVRSDAPYLLIAGDLTGGRRQSHTEFAQMLRDAEERSGKSVFVINGNHDCAASDAAGRITMESFREIYRDFGYDRAFAVHDASASYAADLSDSVRLLAVDSCIYGEDEGQIDTSLFNWIKAQLAQAEANNKTILVMMHHSILPHYALQPMFKRSETIARYLADHGAHLVLTGHIHANDAASAKTNKGNVLYDLQTGSLITSPNAYRVVTLTPDGAQTETRFITQIDTSLLPGDCTAAQRDAMETDFPAYAFGYFEAGVCKWLNRNIGSPNRFARWFKIKEGTKAYDALCRVTKEAGSAIGQNLYGDGSMAETLLHHGVSLPESEYRKLYQPAAKIMYGFFHGNETSVSSRTDAELVRKGVQAALLYGLQTALPESRRVTEFAAALPGAKTAREIADRFADALICTLADGFTDDYSAPDDLACALPFGTAPQTGTRPLSVFLRILQMCVRFFSRCFTFDHTASLPR